MSIYSGTTETKILYSKKISHVSAKNNTQIELEEKEPCKMKLCSIQRLA